jgi:hypothetical protein
LAARESGGGGGGEAVSPLLDVRLLSAFFLLGFAKPLHMLPLELIAHR